MSDKTVREPVTTDESDANAHAVENEHSHYRPHKPDIKNESDIRAEELSGSSHAEPSNGRELQTLSVDEASAQPPDDIAGIEVKPTGKVAGGIPAIINTMKHAWREMGAARSFKTLSQVNQKDGFDCPGCAWPDPDGERTHTEFCENGAKAVAEEATLKRVTPEFFREWSVAELSPNNPISGSANRDASRIPIWLPEGGNALRAVALGEAFRLSLSELNALATPDEASFTHRAEPATRPRFSTSFSCANSARTICRTARTCATNRAALR